MNLAPCKIDRQLPIAHVVRDLELASGGPSRSIPQLIEALDELPQDPAWLQYLVFGDRGKPNAELSHMTRARIHGIKAANASIQVLAQAIQQIHVQDPLRLIHVHGLWSPTLHSVIMRARQLRIPYIVSPRGMLSEWCFNHKRLKKRIGWWLYQRSDLQRAAAVHVTSEAEKEDVRRLGVRSDIVVVPNGTNLRISQRSITERSIRTALCITRLHPVKGLDMLIEAWATLRPHCWRLIIAGPSEEGMRERLIAQIAKLDLTQQIELRAEVDEPTKTELFMQADLFVLPSQSENFGMSIAESLAIGVPVVTTTGTPWADVSTYKCGWIVPPRTADLTKALQSALAASTEVLFEMGQCGRQLILDKFTWPAVAHRMRAVYQSIIQPESAQSPGRATGTVNTIHDKYTRH